MSQFTIHLAGGLLLSTLLAGCGGAPTPSNVGRVSGHVTLEGQPLPSALVTFSPVEQGATSSLGRTDEDGNYTLVYAQGVDGAHIGQHRVSITTFDEGDPDGDPPRPAVAEKVPAKYNYQTELTADVKAGENSIDFPLKNDGPILATPPEEPDSSFGTCQ